MIRLEEKDLTLSDNLLLTTKQLSFLLKTTPAKHVKERPAKGGGKWKYVDVAYVVKVLNLMFGWDWDFRIDSQSIEYGEVSTVGTLTVRCGERSLSKTNVGNKEIVIKKGSDQPLSIGNDRKASASDCLKRCAMMLGIANDVYYPDSFTPVEITETTLDELHELMGDKGAMLPPDVMKDAQRIIDNQETANYSKLYTILQNA